MTSFHRSGESDHAILETTAFDWVVHGVPVLSAKGLRSLENSNSDSTFAALVGDGKRPVALATLSGDVPELLKAQHANTVPVDEPILEVVRRLTQHKQQALIVVDHDQAFVGTITLADVTQVRRTASLYAKQPIERQPNEEFKRFGGDRPEIRPEAPYVARPGCECELILFIAEGIASLLIDLFTGNLGYSHSAIVCCLLDPDHPNEEILIESIPEGVVRRFVTTYGDRAMWRFPLRQTLRRWGMTCEEFCAGLGEKLGQEYDYWEGVSGTDQDQDQQTCSGMIFDCLPHDLRLAILRDMVAREVADEDDIPDNEEVHPHPHPSPNDLAAYFGGPESPLGLRPPPRPEPLTQSVCRVRAELIGVEHSGDDIGNDWTYRVTVQGRTTVLRGRSTSAGHFDSLNRVVFDDNVGPCIAGVPWALHLHVHASENDIRVDDWGTGSDMVRATCPSQTVNVREGRRVAQLRFIFVFVSQCPD